MDKSISDFNVSIEQFYLICESAINDCNVLDTTIDEINRVQDASDAFEDITINSNLIEVAEPSHLVLVDAAVRTGLAGQDVNVSEIIPNLEKYVGKRIDLQGLSDHVMALWRWIQQKLEEAWKIIYDFGYKYLGTIPRLRSSLQSIKKRAESGNLASFDWPQTFDFGIELYGLTRNDKTPTKARDIIEGLSHLQLQLNHYLGAYFENYVTIYEDLESMFSELSDDNLETQLNAITDKILPLTTTGLPNDVNTEAVTDKRFGNDYISLPPLPNNKTIFIRQRQVPDKTNAVLRAECVQSMVPVVRDSKPLLKRSAMSYTFNTMNPNEIIEIVQICLDMLDVVEDVLKGEMFERLKKAKKDLQIATDAVVKHGSSEDKVGDKTTLLRTAVKYNTMMTAIQSQLIVGLTTVALVASRSVLAVTTRNIKL